MKLSVIILNYNVQHFLEICIESVLSATSTLDSEIIVVDNHSSDGSCNMVKKCFPQIKLIENTQNFGFPKGNNIGVAAATGEFICILNPDTIIAEDTFAQILEPKNWQKNTGIIGCKLVDGTGNFLPESKRGLPTPSVALTKVLGLYKISRFFGKYYAMHLKENQSGKVDILVGAFMVMKRDLYQKVGGFDENCFMYSDDIDLSYMVTKLGYQNQYFHETMVVHFKGESTLKDGTYMKRFQEAMNFFYQKHFKVSLIFSGFMKVGIVVFSFLKKFQGNTKTIKKPAKFSLLSDNLAFRDTLAAMLQRDVVLFTEMGLMHTIVDTELIFDSNFIDFKTIIAAMDSKKNQGYTFKITSKNRKFMLGSNSASDRGQVIFIENEMTENGL